MIMALLGVVMAATELYVVERLAHQVEVHRSLAAHEREQRLALERSERERMREREQREQAQHALERSRRIEALARMAGGVAHDFNNALTVIIGGTEMARNRRLSPAEVDECLNEVLQAASGAAELARRLLTLGRQQISKPQADVDRGAARPPADLDSPHPGRRRAARRQRSGGRRDRAGR